MSPARDDDRLAALDGLRGVAAVVVMLSHIVLASVATLGTAAYLDLPALGAWKLVANSPLAVVWAGSELVTVFFVLSAFVLTRAALRAGSSWRAGPYYVGRLVRLYLPVWGSVALAAMLALALARPATVSGTDLWLSPFRAPVSFSMASHSLSLASARPGAPLNGALWSLHWEVLFSLALPLALLAAPLLRRQPLPILVLALAAVAVAPRPGALTYLAPFVVGTVLALREDAIVAARDRLAGRRVLGLLAPGAAILLTADLWLPDATRGAGRGGALVVVGAALAVLTPLLDPRCAAALRRPTIQWLGRRSYSLYLVHEPIVVALAFALGGPSFWLLAPVATVVSLLAAALFHRVVERPSQQLARAAAAQIATRKTTRAAPPRAAPVKA
jgi:peptidoglycan/LPS O-acetylase OafA/YrhL